MMSGYPYVLSLTKNMTWKDHGTVEVKTGHMSINTAEVEKLYIRYMPGTTVARNNCVGFMIIFGKDERTKFEESRESFSAEVQKIYDESKTYHDGKWVMFYPGDESLFSDFMRLLAIKRKPNKNQ